MYRGFAMLGSATTTPEIRLFPIARQRKDRPSLVSLAHDADSQTAAILLGRIYYRKDLLARLPRSHDLHAASDAEAALATYRHLGRQGLERLEGEFALAIWDGRLRRLWAQRDPFGCWPLFWSVRDGVVGLSTSLDALVAEQPGRSFNLDVLAEFLMQPMPADELPCEETAFEGVQRVRPGAIVEFGPTGAVTRHQYWSWASRIGRPEVHTLEEAGSDFAALLREAVRQRMPREGRLAAHLSGGMDSSSLVCLARDELAAQASPSSLLTLSLVYQRRGLVRERSYIDLVLRQGGPVQSHFLEADGVHYFDWFARELPRHDEPAGLLRSMPNHRRLIEAADQLDAVMTLSGEGSDEIACYQPYRLADQLRRGHWVAAAREARQWARGRNLGMWSVLRKYGLEPLCPVWFREGWRSWTRQGYGTWPNLSFFTVPPWIRPEFAHWHQMRQRGRTYADRIFGSPTEVSWNTFMLATTSGDWERWHLAAPLGLNLSHPFRDPRLVCYTLGLPPHVRGVPGMTKPVLETAMRGVLPEEIRTKRCSPGFDDVYGLGLRGNMPQLEQLIRHPAFHELGIVDVNKLLPVLHQAALGIGDAQATDRLDKTLTLIAWFDQIVRRPRAGEPFVSWHLEPIDSARLQCV